jgi:hypothetical protein
MTGDSRTQRVAAHAQLSGTLFPCRGKNWPTHAERYFHSLPCLALAEPRALDNTLAFNVANRGRRWKGIRFPNPAAQPDTTKVMLESGGIGGIIESERRQHERAIQHVQFFCGLRSHFRQRLFCGKASQQCRPVCCGSVRTCRVSIVAWACSYQPIAANLTRFPNGPTADTSRTPTNLQNVMGYGFGAIITRRGEVCESLAFCLHSCSDWLP